MGSARYSLLRKIGTGGMAEVWKARGEKGFVAIKKVLPSLSASRDTIEMLLEEARLVAALAHPNIVQVFDFGHDEEEWFIALEYVGGCNLNDLLKRAGDFDKRIPFEVALYIALECCKALGFAHASTDEKGAARNLVHRDVSPHNILLSWDGEVKLTDFGIAKAAQSVSRTQVGVVRGKAAYLSPEQMESQPLDRRSDLFSLGLVLFELIKGRRFFDAPSLPKLLDQIAAFQKPGEEITDLPREMRDLLRGILRRNRAERFSDASHMEHALAGVLGEEGLEEARRALAQILQQLFEEEHWRDDHDAELTTPAESTGGEIETARTSVTVLPPAGQEHSMSSGVITLTSSIFVDDVLPAEPPGPPTRVRAETAKPAVERTEPEKRAVARVSAAATVGPPRRESPRVVPVSEPAFEPTEPHTRERTETAPGPRARPRRAWLLTLFTIGGIGAATIWAERGPRGGEAASPTNTALVLESPASSPTETPGATAAAATAVALSTATAAPTPTAAATPRRTPVPLASRRASASPAPPPVATAAATPTALAAADTRSARLWVSARPWVEVWVDGKRVAEETPLRNFALVAGRHALRFENSVSGFRLDRDITLRPGEDVDLYVDTTASANHVTQSPHH